jgi:hypothetical protein
VISRYDDHKVRAELERQRVRLCRLAPARALVTLEEAELFLLDRGMLTLTVDSALPSLFGATHERPFAPGRPGVEASTIDELVGSRRLQTVGDALAAFGPITSQ